MPAKVSVKDRPLVTAAFANDVEGETNRPRCRRACRARVGAQGAPLP